MVSRKSLALRDNDTVLENLFFYILPWIELIVNLDLPQFFLIKNANNIKTVKGSFNQTISLLHILQLSGMKLHWIIFSLFLRKTHIYFNTKLIGKHGAKWGQIIYNMNSHYYLTCNSTVPVLNIAIFFGHSATKY